MKKIIAVVIGLAASAGLAFGAVVFDPDTGEGFAGKGDVQEAFGWNNQQLQTNGPNVEFTWEVRGTFSLVCSRVHSVHGYQEQTFNNRVVAVEAYVLADTRRNSQDKITGFLLDGFGEELSSGEGCPSGWPDEVSRTPNPDADSLVGLVAHHDDDSVLIYPTE